MQAEHLGDLLANRVHRVERGHRLLEDDADLLAPDLPHLLRAERHQVAAVPEDLPLDDPARRHGDQLEHGHRGHGLAAAGLPHYPDALAAVDGYVHAVDRTDHPVLGREMRLQSADLKQSLRHLTPPARLPPAGRPLPSPPPRYAVILSRSEERRLGKEGVSTVRSRWAP